MPQFSLKDFLSLPINPDETLQGGVLSMNELIGISEEEDLKQLSFVLWRLASSELVHAKPLLPEMGDRLEAIVGVLLEFYTEFDFPSRPAKIECNDQALAEELGEALSGSGTVVSFAPDMEEWTELLEGFRQRFDSLVSAPSLAVSGNGEQPIREFAEAAAAFYRSAPWDYLEDVDLIKIETPRPPRGLKYAVVLGAGSQTYGLGFYDDEEDHYALMAQRADVNELELCSLTFDSLAEISPQDALLWKEWDLPLETGEAFPVMSLFSEGEARSPTPKELDFATILLKTLADTSEEDLDSGRWTKWIQFKGKRKKCVLSLPDLLDPPDHQEWIRRGKMPEPRGNEQFLKHIQEFVHQNCEGMDADQVNAAIHAKFMGRSMGSFALPAETPQERAEVLCQESVQTFGRRRLILAKQALAEDPDHVEANILLAESTKNAEQAVERFQHAKELGRKQLGPLMEEAAGEFWMCTETRPYMRACHGLATTLQKAGQTSDAIAEYQEMLRLNPNDNQGVRYELIPLLVAHNRESDAIRLLNDYREETAFWSYMKSLVEYRHSGSSSASKKAMRAAFKANRHVVSTLQSAELPRFPDSYAQGTPEEAIFCIGEMEQAWDETKGYVEWMFRENFVWEKEQEKKLREQKRRQRKKASDRRTWRRR